MGTKVFDSSGDYISARQAWAEALRLQVRVLAALVRRETRAHFGESRLGYLWAIIEPVMHLMGYVLLFSVILRRSNPVGGSLALFILTGLIPYFLYSKLATYLSGAIIANKALLNLPPVKPFDVIASRAILEATTYLFVGVILLTSLLLSGIPEAVPQDPVVLTAAIAAIVTFGFGLGMINAVLQAFISNWQTIFTLTSGPIYLLSGVFFLIDEIPHPMQDYLLYNPLLHFVSWFRSGFYPGYSAAYLDRGYALYWSISALVLGLGLLRVTRRKLLEPT